MKQGKTRQPRRILEASLKGDPRHLPTRIALVKLAILEGDPERAVGEAKQATSYALLKCRESGLGQGDYLNHQAGQMLLRTLNAAGLAYKAAGEEKEAINALAVVVQEDPDDTLALGVAEELCALFLEQGKAEGVVGLYRLGFTRGLSLVDVTLTLLAVGQLQAGIDVFIGGLEHVSNFREAFSVLAGRDELENDDIASYLVRRREIWKGAPTAKKMARRLLAHPIVKKTLELIEELAESNVDVGEATAQMADNLRDEAIVASILNWLEDVS